MPLPYLKTFIAIDETSRCRSCKSQTSGNSPGEAQADFGEADFYVRGMRTTLSFFVMTFPYSNVGLAQVFPGETSECVCQALRNVFEHVGGVPTKIVFDNATGVGRRVGGGVRTTDVFRQADFS